MVNTQMPTCATPEQTKLLAAVMDGSLPVCDHKFALGLVAWRKPTDKQMYWVNELLNRVGAPKVAPDPSRVIDVKGILDMFATARQALKRPKITLIMTETPRQIVRVALDRHGTSLWLNSEHYGATYGRIMIASGELVLKPYGNQHETRLKAVLQEFSKSPREVAIRHGKLTGNCCFCQLPLSDERSLHEGYGKRCARHWGLPWGNRPGLTPVGNWVLNNGGTL